jgi:TPR repeat protein
MSSTFGADDFRVVLGDGAMRRGDYLQALEAYRDAANAGLAAGQHNLAVLYQEGRGVAVDLAEALTWFRKAAEQGAPPSQTNLGLMYYHGQGVAPDYAQAISWIRRAADQGSAPAEYALGTIYDSGKGVARDESEALRWFERAAQKGHPDAAAAWRRLRDRQTVLREAERTGTVYVGAAPAGVPASPAKKCFIATAACGSEDAPDVAALRRFRDGCLARRRLGRAAIAAYELGSPPVAAFISTRPVLRALVRVVIVRPVARAAGRLARPSHVWDRGIPILRPEVPVALHS